VARAAGELTPDPAEQAALARMRAMRDQGASLRGIAATLDAEGTRRFGQVLAPG